MLKCLESRLKGTNCDVAYIQLHISLCCLSGVAAQGSAARAADNSMRPDLLSLSISMQQSLSASAACSSQSVPVIRSSAPSISTAGQHRTGYSAAGNLPASGYSWTSQMLSGVQHPYSYTASLHIAEGASELFEPAAVQSVPEQPRLTRPAAEGTTSEAQDDSRLAVVPGGDTSCDETADESSMLSLSVNRLV